MVKKRFLLLTKKGFALFLTACLCFGSVQPVWGSETETRTGSSSGDIVNDASQEEEIQEDLSDIDVPEVSADEDADDDDVEDVSAEEAGVTAPEEESVVEEKDGDDAVEPAQEEKEEAADGDDAVEPAQEEKEEAADDADAVTVPAQEEKEEAADDVDAVEPAQEEKEEAADDVDAVVPAQEEKEEAADDVDAVEPAQEEKEEAADDVDAVEPAQEEKEEAADGDDAVVPAQEEKEEAADGDDAVVPAQEEKKAAPAENTPGDSASEETVSRDNNSENATEENRSEIIISEEAIPSENITEEAAYSSSGEGVPNDEEMANATNMSLDTAYNVAWNEGAVSWFRFTSPETGYYAVSTSGHWNNDSRMIYFHDAGNWYSQGPTVSGNFRVLLLEGYEYYFGAFTMTPDANGEYNEYLTDSEDGIAYPVAYSMTLSKAGGFDGFVSGCESWNLADEPSKSIEFPKASNGYYIRPVKIILPEEDGEYHFEISPDGNSVYRWPILLDSSGGILEGPAGSSASTGEISAYLSGGTTCYLIDTAIEAEALTYIYTGENLTANTPAQKSDQTITTSAASFTKTFGNAAFSLGAATSGDGKLTYTSDKTAVAAVSSTGQVTIKGAGTAKITITAAATDNYNAATKTITVTVNKASQTITASSLTLTYPNTGTIAASGNKGSLAYKSGNTSIAAVDSAGKVTAKGAGTAKITITAAATDNYNAATKTITVTVNKAAQSVTASNLTLTYPNTGTIAASGNKGSLTYKSDNTSIAAVDSAGKVTAKGAGTAKITITAAATSNYNAATKTITVTVNKAAQSITAKAAASSVAVGKTTTVSITGAKGTKSYKSSDTSIATVTSAGKVTAKKVGTVKITATSAATANYKAASKTVTIKVVPGATTSLSAANQATGIKLAWKKVAGATGYFIYINGNKVATISSGSTITYTRTQANTNGKKYVIKIVAKADTGTSTLSKSITYYKIARPAIPSATNSASKKMTVSWGKNTEVTGYQIQYSTSKTFASGNKSVEITKNSTVSKVIGSLTKGKTYYVRVRAYKTVDDKTYNSAWSPVKTVKIEK